MKNKIFTHTYETRGEKEIDLYKYRIKNIRLTWCKQILNIIHHFNIKKINDLGCNYFQLYKEINFQKKKFSNFGFDCFYILDKATKYSTMEKFLNSKKVHKRNTFILLGIKR